jgi:hypothetical protein
LTTAQVARLTAPLFEPEVSTSDLLALSRDAWDMAHPSTGDALRKTLQDPERPHFRMIATYALGEMAAALVPPPAIDEPVSAGQPVVDTAPDHLDLLGGLIEKEVEEKDVPDERPARRFPLDDLFGALLEETSEEQDRHAVPLSEKLTAVDQDGQPLPATDVPFELSEIKALLQAARADPVQDVCLAAQAAERLMAGVRITDLAKEEDILLSAIEKIIFLKEVPFFQDMAIDQLRVLANVCEEELFEEDTQIFGVGDPGGVLYVVVNGRVGIEQEKRTGSVARLATIEAHSYFGEMNLFDGSPRTTSAVAIQDTLTLRLCREPLIALARQYPELSLNLINVLSQRLREASDRIAELTRTRPRELHKLFDQYV